MASGTVTCRRSCVLKLICRPTRIYSIGPFTNKSFPVFEWAEDKYNLSLFRDDLLGPNHKAGCLTFKQLNSVNYPQTLSTTILILVY